MPGKNSSVGGLAAETKPKRKRKQKKQQNDSSDSDDDAGLVDLSVVKKFRQNLLLHDQEIEEEEKDAEDVLSDEDLCADSDEEDIPMDEVDVKRGRPVRRKLDTASDRSTKDNCVICGEVGRNMELWFRCTSCGYWVHEACSGVDSAVDHVCDHCRKRLQDFH